MYETSRDYLNKLIAKSGIKVGTAKSAAVAAIIELIDENALDGLIKSIKSDYEDMAAIIKKKNSLEAALRRLYLDANDARHEIAEIRSKIQEERAALEELLQQKKEAEYDLSIAGCNDDEKRRLLVYKAAIQVGKEQFDGRFIHDDTMKQILRSASNVAANWERTSAASTGDDDVIATGVKRKGMRRGT